MVDGYVSSGRLVPRRVWRFDGGAGEIDVCGPECEELYETHWRPSYGVIEGSGR